MAERHLNDASFLAPLAHVLYETPAEESRAAAEAYAVYRYGAWLGQCHDPNMIRLGSDFIDVELMKSLSGSSQLAIAKMIEQKSPEILDLLTHVGALRRHLQQVKQLSPVFAPENIERLIQALVTADGVVTQGGS